MCTYKHGTKLGLIQDYFCIKNLVNFKRKRKSLTTYKIFYKLFIQNFIDCIYIIRIHRISYKISNNPLDCFLDIQSYNSQWKQIITYYLSTWSTLPIAIEISFGREILLTKKSWLNTKTLFKKSGLSQLNTTRLI